MIRLEWTLESSTTPTVQIFWPYQGCFHVGLKFLVSQLLVMVGNFSPEPVLNIVLICILTSITIRLYRNKHNSYFCMTTRNRPFSLAPTLTQTLIFRGFTNRPK